MKIALAIFAALVVLAWVLTRALAHDDLSWPAQFKSANNIPCCTLNAGMGDCVRVSHETAMSLRIGSTIALDFPAGYRVVRINVIHSGPEPVVCIPGCAFSPAGV